MLGGLNMLAALLLAAPNAEEEAAMARMLTLQHRSLVSDRPLPVTPLPGAAAAAVKASSDSTSTSAANGACAAAASPDGYPSAVSPWAARFAEDEHARSFAAARVPFPVWADEAEYVAQRAFGCSDEAGPSTVQLVLGPLCRRL